MINSNNSYSKLKEVIVGVELSISKRIADFTFMHFYQSNLNNSIYEKIELNDGTYSVNAELIEKRNAQLDNLAVTLEKEGIKVHRPDRLTKVIPFKTPSFNSELSAASNVRDVTLVMGNKIIETPTYVQNRYFENLSMYNIFDKAYDHGNGGQWIRCPHTELTKDTIDLSPWDTVRDYSQDLSRYVMAIDGAQFLRLNEDVIVNIGSYNHYLGYLWVKSFYPELNFHVVHMADNHIDGSIISLNETTFLVNPKYPEVWKQLPEKFQDLNRYTYLYPYDIPCERSFEDKTDIGIQIASDRGMDINILSIDENTVVVNRDAYGVIKVLEENGFRVIQVELENGEIFGGGIHCSTLDLVRE